MSLLCYLGPGSDIRMKMRWKVLHKTRNSGVWSFLDAEGWLGSGGLADAHRCGKLGTEGDRTTLCGRFQAQSGERCWPLLDKLWRAIAPLMKPWCAEGEAPTAANLNLYRGLHSRVGWHCDDEPLFWRGWVLKAHCFSEFWAHGALQMEGQVLSGQ